MTILIIFNVIITTLFFLGVLQDRKKTKYLSSIDRNIHLIYIVVTQQAHISHDLSCNLNDSVDKLVKMCYNNGIQIQSELLIPIKAREVTRYNG